jgi:hypothetical protein
MHLTYRSPRTIDTSTHFCPHTGCRYRGWFGLGNLRANGHPSGGPWRQYHCIACQGYFPERVFEVDPNTVLRWLVEAAEQLQAFSQYFLCDVYVNQVQLDELYAVLRDVKDGKFSYSILRPCGRRSASTWPNFWASLD